MPSCLAFENGVCFSRLQVPLTPPNRLKLHQSQLATTMYLLSAQSGMSSAGAAMTMGSWRLAPENTKASL